MSWFEWAFFLSLFSLFVIFSFASFALYMRTAQNRRISGISCIVFIFIALLIAYQGTQYAEKQIKEKTIEDIIKLQQEYHDKKFNKPKKESPYIIRNVVTEKRI